MNVWDLEWFQSAFTSTCVMKKNLIPLDKITLDDIGSQEEWDDCVNQTKVYEKFMEVKKKQQSATML